MQIEEIYAIFLKSEGVTTDTRQSVEGKVFFALKGDNFDGNVCVESALEQGAVLAISDSKPSQKSHPNIVYVDNCLWALQDLARYHRQRLNKPVIALIG